MSLTGTWWHASTTRGADALARPIRRGGVALLVAITILFPVAQAATAVQIASASTRISEGDGFVKRPSVPPLAGSAIVP